jgi:nucleoside-diphosphate-sugar epimerase
MFITGATGFLGGALARALAREGAEVHAYARPTPDRHALDGVAVTWHEGDVTVPQTLSGVVAGAAWIIHAVSRLGQPGVGLFSEDRQYSWQRAHDQLGYTPEYDLAAGVARAIAWYRQRARL